MAVNPDFRSGPTILVDAIAIAFGAKYSHGVLSYHGKPTGIIYGFLVKVLSIAKKFKTRNFIFCWDDKKSFRRIYYPDYKKTRREKRKEMTKEEKEEYKSLIDQCNTLRSIVLPGMGFMNNHMVPYMEGDDIIAHWCYRLKGRRKLYILSTDNDLYQLLHLADMILTKNRVFTEKHFIEKYGIKPGLWAKAKSIGGCSSDGVPGVKGVGDPKNPRSKALAYVKGELKKGKIYDRIIGSEKLIEECYTLVKLPWEDVDRILRKNCILRRDKLTRWGFIQVFDKYNFRSFLREETFDKWMEAFI